MTDRISKERRSWNMSRIRSSNTKPERIVRSILHQLGLDQDELSYLHQGRKERLTLVHGKVIEQIV